MFYNIKKAHEVYLTHFNNMNIFNNKQLFSDKKCMLNTVFLLF